MSKRQEAERIHKKKEAEKVKRISLSTVPHITSLELMLEIIVKFVHYHKEQDYNINLLMPFKVLVDKSNIE